MKKVIGQVLKDDNYFNRKKAVLSFSVPIIESEVRYGDTLQGSFQIIADKREEPEGYIYVSDLRMSVSRQEFGGLIMEVYYQFDARGLEEGAVKEGTFQIVSNLGEYELPYRITVSRDVPGSSMGEIRNLFHFTNLAKKDWEEAKQLFYSERFAEVLENSDEEFTSIYRSLIRNGANDQNMENFLVLAKKKTRNVYALDKTEIEMDMPEESTWLSTCVVLEGWGYCNLKVRVTGEFLEAEKECIQEEDFRGNVYELNFYVNRDRLYLGDNKGSLILEDCYNHIELPVVIHCRNEYQHTVSMEKQHLRDLMYLYMDFRLGRTTRQKWTKESMVIISRMLRQNSDDIAARLYQTQVMIMEGRTGEAEQILERLGMMIETAEKEELSYYGKKKTMQPGIRPEIKGYYYYLLSLCSGSEEKIAQCAERVERLYAANYDNWRLAWILLYLRADFIEHDEKKWEFIRSQYSYGLGSPVLFLEAFQIMMRTPSVMTELGEFELAFLEFASRRQVLNREIRSRFVFLVAKLKAFSEEVYALLKICYAQEQRNDTLEAICGLLMKGNRLGKEYFPWYEKAVEQELRITRLYEYYMMSIDLEYEGRLPRMILMYFAYHSNLDYERSAFLYANILKHKADYRELYQEYSEMIEAFTCEQLLKYRINDNLAYLYENVAEPYLMQPSYATAYLELCFTARIHTDKSRMVNVVVTNKYLKEDMVYPLYQGETLAVLAGDSYAIGLEDEAGNRYFDEELYHKEFVMKHRKHMEEIVSYADMNLTAALYLTQCYAGRMSVTDKNAEAVRYLVTQEEITEEYRRELLMLLLDYYFEADDIAGVDEMLSRLHPAQLNGIQRESCIHIMVARGKYEEAMDWIRTYGTESVNYKILLRLCDRVLNHTDFAYDNEILKICMDIFRQGKYDETVLRYLVSYAKGSCLFYKGLWRAADSFDLNVHELLEQMLVQILYTRETIGEEANIYLEYVEYGAKSDLETAFLALLAYKYFNKQEAVEEKVFDRVIALSQLEEPLPIGCKLAYLKKTTFVMKRGRLFDAEKALIPEFIREMTARQIFFPFFMEYRHLVPELELMSDRCFIEYRGTEGSKVVLHYVAELGNEMRREYRKEEMPHMYAGIYVKSFILFYGEKIQYYITEEDGRQEKLTQSSVLERRENMENEVDDRFSMINSLVISREMQDYQTYCNLAAKYARKSFLVSHLFQPE